MDDSNHNQSHRFPPLLHLTYILQQSSDELLLTKVGISLSHARIMSGLSRSAAKSQRQLAHELRQTEANISRQLKAMKKLGLVNIDRNKKDGRQRDVRLTAKGEQKYQEAENILVDLHEKTGMDELNVARIMKSF